MKAAAPRRCGLPTPAPWWHEGRWQTTGQPCQRYCAPGKDRCSVHDPESRAKTAAAHALRKAQNAERRGGRAPQGYRARVIAEIQELPYLWDGPGSEGRCA